MADQRVPDSPHGDVVPAWLRRAGAFGWRFLAIAAFAAVIVWVAFLLGTVTASILVAVMIAAIFAPVLTWLHGRGWSRTAAAAAVTLAAFAIAAAALIGLILLVIPAVADLNATFQQEVADLEAQLASEGTSDSVARMILEAVDRLWGWITTELAGFVGAVAEIVTVAILALFLLFFVVSDGDRAEEWALQGTSTHHRERIRAADGEALRRVGASLRGAVVVSFALVVAFGVALVAFGVPHAAGLAALAVLGGFVPYLGSLIAIGFATVVALGTLDTTATIVLVLILLAATVLAERVLRRAVAGGTIGLHPALVLIVLPVGAAVAGVLGFLVAIPVTATVLVVGRTIIDALEPERAADEGLVPGWFDRLAQWSWRLLAVGGALALVIAGIGLAPLIVAPVVAAAIVAATVAPFHDRLRARGWGRTLAAAVPTAGVFLVVVGLIVVTLAQLAGPIIEAVETAVAGAGAAVTGGGPASEWLEAVAGVVGGRVESVFADMVAGIAVVTIVFVVAALLAFYLVRDTGPAWQRALSLARPWRREALDDAGRRSVDILGSYMFGTAVISAVGAVSQLLIMLILGLPFVVPIAVLSFILCFIPYIGGFISTGLAFLIALQFGTTPQIVIMFIYTIVINIVQGNIVTPLVYNRAVNLHPAVVLLAVPAGGAVAGIAGMFLAVPILAVIAATWRTVLRTLGNKPVDMTPAEAQPDPA